jgi:carboxylesterase type B
LILGANEDGGTIFEPMLPAVVPGAKWPASIFKDTVGLAFDHIFQANSSRFQAVYNATEFKSASWPEDSLISRGIRDLVFMCPLRQLATAYAAQGLPAYMYVFHFNYGFLVDSVLHLGDFHAGEIPFVFRNWLWVAEAIDRNQDPYLMADIMSCKWASFAYTHDPNGGKREADWPPGCTTVNRKYSSWPVFNSRDRLYYSLKIEPEVLPIRADNVYPDDLFPRDPKCDLIDDISEYIRFRHDGNPSAGHSFVV